MLLGGGGGYSLYHMFRKAFSTSNICLADSICLYVKPFRRYLASKLTILEKYSNIQRSWPFGRTTEGLPPRIIQALFTEKPSLADNMPLPWTVKKLQSFKLTVRKKYAKVQHKLLWLSPKLIAQKWTKAHTISGNNNVGCEDLCDEQIVRKFTQWVTVTQISMTYRYSTLKGHSGAELHIYFLVRL